MFEKWRNKRRDAREELAEVKAAARLLAQTTGKPYSAKRRGSHGYRLKAVSEAGRKVQFHLDLTGVELEGEPAPIGEGEDLQALLPGQELRLQALGLMMLQSYEAALKADLKKMLDG